MLPLILLLAALSSSVQAALLPVKAEPPKGSAGLGILIGDAGGGIVVQKVVPGAPGDRAGLSTGDEIVTVDGRDVRRLKVDAVQPLLLGAAGSTVSLEFIREGLCRYTITPAREAGTGARAGELVVKQPPTPNLCSAIQEAAGGAMYYPQATCRNEECRFRPFPGEHALEVELRWMTVESSISGCPDVEPLPGFKEADGIHAKAWRLKSRPDVNVILAMHPKQVIGLRVGRTVPERYGTVAAMTPPPEAVKPASVKPAEPSKDPCEGEDDACYIYMAGQYEHSAEAKAARSAQYLKECEAGNGPSCDPAAVDASLAGRKADAIRLETRGCELGHLKSCYEAGEDLESLGTPRDKMRSVKFYLKACDGGLTHACYRLGTHYCFAPKEKPEWFGREDRRDPWMMLALRDPERAREYYLKACKGALDGKHGCGEAEAIQERCY